MAQQKPNDSAQPIHIKQRVIGAIVLVSLGVIFIPMLLNSERSLDDGMPVFGSNIPNKPDSISTKPKVSKFDTNSAIIIKSQADFESRVIIDDKSPTVAQDKKKSTVASFASPSSKDKTSDKSPAEKKIITVKKLPSAKKPANAWAIQVGSFSDRNNAFKLRNKLRNKKFTAFVESVKTVKGQVYRVRVGPEVKRNHAEKIQKKLVSELKINGLVVAHP